MEALTDLSLPLVVSFSTTPIKPLWIVGRLYCDFLEMCLVLWWRPLCKHHWYDLPIWQTTFLLCMFKGLSLQNDSLVTIDCVQPCSLLLCQIEDFSAGFFDGTKLACWMRGESPWSFFPKISIYLRATNISQSFRITILPQVRTKAQIILRVLRSPHTVHFVTRMYVHCLIFVTLLCNHRSHMRFEFVL